jgi:hypothetical protein
MAPAKRAAKKNPPNTRRPPRQPMTRSDTATAGVRGNTGFRGSYRPTKPMPTPNIPNAEYEAVCSLSDPFCPAARDARWPDGVGNRTLTFQIRKSFLIGTDAQGECAIFFRPEYPYNLNTGTVAGLSATTGATWSAAQSFSGVGLYRVTTAGIRVMSNMTPMTEKGEVWIATSPTSFNTLQAYDVANPLLWTEVYTSSLKNGTVSEWVATPNTPASRILVKNNSSGNTDHANLDNSAWTECVIVGQGLDASNSTAMRIEVYLNLEYVPDSSGAAVFYATLAPPVDPEIQAAVALAQRGKETSTKKVMSDKEGRDLAEKLAKLAVSRAKAGLRGFLKGGPAGAARRLLTG